MPLQWRSIFAELCSNSEKRVCRLLVARIPLLSPRPPSIGTWRTCAEAHIAPFVHQEQFEQFVDTTEEAQSLLMSLSRAPPHIRARVCLLLGRAPSRRTPDASLAPTRRHSHAAPQRYLPHLYTCFRARLRTLVVGAVGPTPPKKPPPSAVGFNKINRRVRAMIKRGVELGLTDQLEQTIRGWLESEATEVPAPVGDDA